MELRMATDGSQQLEKAEQDKYELQRKLKSALAAGPSAAQKVCFVWFWTYKRNRLIDLASESSHSLVA